MKKTFLKFLRLIIIIALIVQLCPLNLISKASTVYNYYVINGGKGDGRSENSPAASVADVIKTINSDGLGEKDTANVYILQRADYQTVPNDNKHFITYWSADGSQPSSHTAKIVVLPYDVSVKTELASTATLGAANQVIKLSGPTIFRGIRILSMRGYWNRDIYTYGNELTVERDVTFGDLASGKPVATQCYGLHFSIANTEDSEHNKPIILNYNAPTIADGSIYLSSYRNVSTIFNQDVNVTIDNPNLGSHQTISFPIQFNGKTTYNKNLNLKIKNADKIVFKNTDNASVTAKGGIQVISDSSVNFTEHISNLSCFSNDTKIWEINLEPSAKDSLEFTDTAGRFSVTKNFAIIAENENGDIIYSDENGFLTLKSGVWNISKKPSIHYGDSNADGNIDVRDLINIKKLIAAVDGYYLPSDINSDNKVNASDIVLIKQHLLGTNPIKWDTYKIDLTVPMNLSGGADKEAAALKNSIQTAPDTISGVKTTYYISENGNDSNSGTSPQEPITVAKITSLSLKQGDVILFKRGETFRLSNSIHHRSGIRYGAYGSGEKPIISGSLKNYADNSLWNSTDGDLWQLNIAPEAAHIVFNDGETIAERKTSLDLVKKDGDYFHDTENGILFLYLTQHNPGNYFDSIEISTTKWLVFGGSASSPASNIYFENISFKYAAEHALYIIGTKDFEMKNCEFYWIGGAYCDNNGKRLGNAIQFWSYAENCNVNNCYFYEIFDAPLTYQGLSVNQYIDMTFENNLIEYCSMNFEFWGQNSDTATNTSSDPEALLKNTNFQNNILRFGGYGFGGLQRPYKGEQSFILTWYTRYNDSQIQNINICNNIFDIANCSFFFIDNIAHQLNISGNTYYQKSGSQHKVVNNCSFFSSDQYSFEKAIKLVDKTPKHIEWLE